MKLAILVLFVVVSAVCALKPGHVYEQFRCEPGKFYKENNCNNCECAQGTLACTKMQCPQADPALRNCEANTAWNDGCKRCWCHVTLKTICTKDCHH